MSVHIKDCKITVGKKCTIRVSTTAGPMKVEAVEVVLNPQFGDATFYMHPSISHPKRFNITDSRTGWALAYSPPKGRKREKIAHLLRAFRERMEKNAPTSDVYNVKVIDALELMAKGQARANEPDYDGWSMPDA